MNIFRWNKYRPILILGVFGILLGVLTYILMGSSNDVPMQPQIEPPTIVLPTRLTPVGIRRVGTLPLPPTPVIIDKTAAKTEREISGYEDRSGKEDVEIYLRQVQPISTSSEFFYQKLMELIGQSNQPTDMNTFLNEYSHRLFYLYQSSMLLKVPDQANDHHIYLLRTFINQKEWVDKLMNNAWLDSKRGVVQPRLSFSEATKKFQSLASEFNLEYPLELLMARSLHSYRHGVKIDFPGDWILADNDFQLALIAPVKLHGRGIESLGPSTQKYGSSFKLWAVDNKEGLDLHEVDIEVKQFVNAFGIELERELITIDGTSAIKRILKNSTLKWQTLFIVLVKYDKKYFVQGVCPEALFKSCNKQFHNILDNVTLEDEPKS